jgi:hypothetical protein
VHGYTGKLLEVDPTTRQTRLLALDPAQARAFIGALFVGSLMGDHIPLGGAFSSAGV